MKICFYLSLIMFFQIFDWFPFFNTDASDDSINLFNMWHATGLYSKTITVSHFCHL
jgi:hypothetical protein